MKSTPVRPSKGKHLNRPASIQVGAEYTGLCSRTIRRYISAGYITGYRIGPRVIRIDLDDLDALMTTIPSAG